MRKSKKVLVWLTAAFLMVGAVGCSKKKSDVDYSQSYTESDSKVMDYADNGYSPEEMADSSDTSNAVQITNTNQKLIKRVNMSLETLSYDSFMASIDQMITQMNGYVEQSESYGRHIGEKNLQHATMTVRVPSNRLDEFTNMVGENTTVTNKSVSTEDVTMNYVDTEARKKALSTQLDRLFVLLEKADKMEDIIALEQRISDVTYELENYTSTLRTYDNLVDYSTVTLDINEVERTSNPEPESVWEEMGNGFVDTMYNIKDGLQGFAIWFVSNIPYLIFWAAVITIGVIVWRKKKHHKNEKSLVQNKDDHKE